MLTLFIDRNGTINRLKDNYRPEDFEFEKGALEGIFMAAISRFRVIVISDGPDEHYEFTDKLIRELKNNHVYLDRSQCYFDSNTQRAINTAAHEHNIDLSESYMIGDKYSDIEAGINAGCKGSILLQCGEPLPQGNAQIYCKLGYKEDSADKMDFKVEPTIVADNLCSAVGWIIKQRYRG